MRAVEFAAELSILLLEGPQDKKQAVDLYYKHYAEKFPESRGVEDALRHFLEWISKALPSLKTARYRKPVDLYGLIGAMVRLQGESAQDFPVDAEGAGQRLIEFESSLRATNPHGAAARYLAAVARQTDNIIPRNTRIESLNA
jgi:hypothetical protein